VHVVTKLQILTEIQCLGHDNVSKGLEYHYSNRVSRLNVTDDELSEDVETKLNVREGLVPEVLFDPSLILSPQIFYLGQQAVTWQCI
jgi:hypothetical protein